MVTLRYYTDPDFLSCLKETISKASLLIVINGKFELGWLSRLGCSPPSKCRIWDCQIAEYVLSGQTNSFASMEQLCSLYSIPGKAGGLEDYWAAGVETRDIPRERVLDYNRGDGERTRAIYEAQLSDKRMSEKLRRLILLQGLDQLCLQEMEENGILYDADGSRTKGDELLQELDAVKASLQDVIGFPYFNLDSGDHLSCLLYGGTVEYIPSIPVEKVYKSGPKKGETYTRNESQEPIRHQFPGLFKPLKGTELKKAGYYQTGEPILRQLPVRNKVQRQLIDALLRVAELSKQVGSFLHALPELFGEMGWEGNLLHPTYNQCVARTGRLSCSKPNAQQFPDIVDQFWISRYDCQRRRKESTWEHGMNETN